MTTGTRRTLLFFGIFAFFLLAYFVLRVVFAPGITVPPEFYDARTKGAVIAQNIVNESNGIVGTMNTMSDLEKQGKTQEALKNIATVRGQAKDIRSLAVDLSKELDVMNTHLPDISSEEARQAGLESITDRLALLSRLITYTDEVNRLANALELHFTKNIGKSADIQKLVNDINSDVKAVNAFNSQAGQAMDRFDKIVR
jgi:hypothetical protein